MRQTTILAVVLTSFLGGNFFASFFWLPWEDSFISWGYFILIFCSLFIALLLFYKSKLLFYLIIGLLFVYLGVLFYFINLPRIDNNHIGNYLNQTLKVEGWVDKQRKEKLNHSYYRLQVDKIKTSKGKVIKNVKGKLRLRLANDNKLNFGDRVVFRSKVFRPKSNDDFDYRSYLAKDDIFALAYPKMVKKVGRKDFYSFSLDRFKKELFKAKQFLIARLSNFISQPYNDLFAGLLFGQESALSEVLEDDFIKTGLIHIVVVSGYNISILTKFFVNEVKKLSIRLAFFLGSLVVVVFVLMVGANAPALRAGLMAQIVLIGSLFGRRAHKLNLLLAAATLMAFLNPQIVRYDTGFQLSFLATFGLFYFSPFLKYFLVKIGYRRFLPKILRSYLLETLSAQILTFPLIIYIFGRVSLVAPLTNLLVLPFIPAAMTFGFIAAIFSLIWSKLALFFGWLEEVILRYIVFIARSFSQISISSINLKWFNIYGLIISYFLIIYLIYWFNVKKSNKKVSKEQS